MTKHGSKWHSPLVTIRTVRRVVVVVECTCARCGHVWTPRKKGTPMRCAGCKSLGWQNAPRWRRPDRARRKRRKA